MVVTYRVIVSLPRRLEPAVLAVSTRDVRAACLSVNIIGREARVTAVIALVGRATVATGESKGIPSTSTLGRRGQKAISAMAERGYRLLPGTYVPRLRPRIAPDYIARRGRSSV